MYIQLYIGHTSLRAAQYKAIKYTAKSIGYTYIVGKMSKKHVILHVYDHEYVAEKLYQLYYVVIASTCTFFA